MIRSTVDLIILLPFINTHYRHKTLGVTLFHTYNTHHYCIEEKTMWIVKR